MPLLNTITTPYAEAFLQVATSREEVEKVVEQARAYGREVATVDETRAILKMDTA